MIAWKIRGRLEVFYTEERPEADEGPFLREEREKEIVEAYRKGYGEQPQEDWVGEIGLWAAGLLNADDPWPQDASAEEPE